LRAVSILLGAIQTAEVVAYADCHRTICNLAVSLHA